MAEILHLDGAQFGRFLMESSFATFVDLETPT